MNIQIIEIARVYKAEGNEFLSQIQEIQLRLNSCYNASCRNNLFVTVLDLNDNLGLNTFPYPINNYQPATLRHTAESQALTRAKASPAKQANLYRTLEPKYKVGDKVLLFTKNINIKNVSLKMKPL